MKPIHARIMVWGIIISFLGIALLFYWAVLDGVYVNRVLNMQEIHYTTDRQEYRKGEEVGVIVDGLCKYRAFPAETYVTLVDTIVYIYEAKHRFLPLGCVSTKTHYPMVMLPANSVPSGEYHISGYFLYDINPVRSGGNALKIPFRTNEFKIIN